MIRSSMVIPLAGCILIAILVGCRTASPPVNFYVLQPLIEEQEAGSLDGERTARTIGIQTVELPGYLDRKAIVRRAEGHRLEIESLHRWADYLDRMTQQTIRVNLQTLMPHARVISAPWPVGVKPDVTVHYQFQELIGSPGQTMIMSVAWGVNDQHGTIAPHYHQLRLSEQLSGTSIEALTAAHSLVLEILCRKTAESLDAYMRP